MRATRVVALLLAGAVTIGCGGTGGGDRGRASPGTPAQAAADTSRAGAPSPNDAPLGEFEALTRADVELHVKVMRAAAERLKNLSAADREALKVFQQMTTNPPAAGSIPSPEQIAALQRAGDLTTLDSVVAREMGVSRRYSSISSRVSSFIGPEMTGEGDDEPMTAEQKAQLRIRIQKFDALKKQDAAVLAPFREELGALDRQVHVLTHPESMPR